MLGVMCCVAFCLFVCVRAPTRYTPADADASPAKANVADFPVRPGGAMPIVPGCNKVDYWVLFVVGLPA